MVEGEAVTLVELDRFELFLEGAHEWQRGLWIDRESGRWVRVGLGSVILGIDFSPAHVRADVLY